MNEEDTFKERDTSKLVSEPLYPENKLTFDGIKTNPILKPIAIINNSFMNFELLINRAMWEYEQDKKAIDDMIALNPKYSETIIFSKIQSLLGHIKMIIHSQDIQKDNMKSTIQEMIQINDEEYILKTEIEESNKIRDEPNEIINSSLPEEEIPFTENDNEKDEEKEFNSELLEKRLPTPSKGGFIPIKKKT